MAVAAQIGCSFCLDIGYFQALNQKLDPIKASQVPRWRESDVFTPLEQNVLEYAEAMTNTPPTVTDELSANLLKCLGPAAMVELTVFIAFSNLAARANITQGVESQGFSSGCAVPLAKRFSEAHKVDQVTEDPFTVRHGVLFTVGLRDASVGDPLGEAVAYRSHGSGIVPTLKIIAQVHDPRAYLLQVITRQALNRLRTQVRRREDYIGEWLPEPLLTSPDVADDVEFAENISIAMLTVLETLGPTERVVFVLREVFGAPYDEIAEAIGKSTVAVRQIARRARDHVVARRPRVRVHRSEQRVVVERFLAAVRSGEGKGGSSQ